MAHIIDNDVTIDGNLTTTGIATYCAWIHGFGNQTMTGSGTLVGTGFWGTPTMNESRSFLSFDTDEWTFDVAGFYMFSMTFTVRQSGSVGSQGNARLCNCNLVKGTSTFLSQGQQPVVDVSSADDTINATTWTYAGSFAVNDTFHFTIQSLDSTTGELDNMKLLITRC